MRPAGIGMLAFGLIAYIAYPKFTNEYVDGVQQIGLIFIVLGILSFVVSLIPVLQQSRRESDRRNSEALRPPAPRDRYPGQDYGDRY